MFEDAEEPHSDADFVVARLCGDVHDESAAGGFPNPSRDADVEIATAPGV